MTTPTDLAYPCDLCGVEYDTEDEALACEEMDEAEEEARRED